MKPARLSARPKPMSRRPLRSSVVVSKRVLRRRPQRRAETKSKETTSLLMWIFKQSITILAFGSLLLGGAWLLGRYVLLPNLLFTDQSRQTISYISDSDTSQILLLQLAPNWEDSELVYITGFVRPEASDAGLERALSQQLGILVDQVVELPIQMDGFSTGAAITDVLPVENLPQRLLHTRTPYGRALQQLQFVAASYDEQINQVSRHDFKRLPILPSIDPGLGARCPVAVTNTTAVPGLAETASTVFERTGMLVVRTASAATPLLASRLRVTDQLSSDCLPIVERLQHSLGLELQNNTSQEELREFEQYRAEVIVELGSDWWSIAAE